MSRRLAITPPELRILRAALVAADEGVSATARVIAGRIVALAPIQSQLPAGRGPSRPSVTPRSAATAPIERSRFRNWTEDLKVHITAWGDVVHLFYDCPGTRGFTPVGQPEPPVFPAVLRDPVCADRRACRICFNDWSSDTIAGFDEWLRRLHGGRRQSTGKHRLLAPPAYSNSGSNRMTLLISSSPPPIGSRIEWSGYSGEVIGTNSDGVQFNGAGFTMTASWGEYAILTRWVPGTARPPYSRSA